MLDIYSHAILQPTVISLVKTTEPLAAASKDVLKGLWHNTALADRSWVVCARL